MKRIYLIFLLSLLCGCRFVGTIYNVGSKVGAVVMDERELKDDWNDTKINMSIRSDFMKSKISYVLDAMNIERNYAEGAVRISLSRYNTKDEIDIAINEINNGVMFLRKFKRR
jgi:selenocysteine lyase/cysteine desulfurase